MKSIELGKMRLLVHRKVYEPSDDSWLLIDTVEETLRERRLLDSCIDLGCGTGILGLYALSRDYCRRVIFIDINPYATMNTYVNLAINRLKPRGLVLLSEPYMCANKVDAVLANPPYLPRDDYTGIDIYGDRSVIGGSEGFETLLSFIDFASESLARGGLLFITYSSLTKPSVVESYIVDKGFDIITKKTRSFFFEELIAIGAVKK